MRGLHKYPYQSSSYAVYAMVAGKRIPAFT